MFIISQARNNFWFSTESKHNKKDPILPRQLLWDTYIAEGDALPDFLVYIAASLIFTELSDLASQQQRISKVSKMERNYNIFSKPVHSRGDR
ncbi:uncharacterized protein [Spinacia oleracea]|uniref:Uncharacterized protein isoform X2 n=1 Tax=Spinacia oleracea TaxID=3562 RepID=A0ABM3QTE9_SPIOL|nr:uncharacterized protein LOC110781937 isoform X2 [Spinacia oleracea]